MFKINSSLILLVAVLSLALASCKDTINKKAAKAVEMSNVTLKVVRFDHELLKLKGVNDSNLIASFNIKHAGFFNLFNANIIRVGPCTSKGYNDRLQDFLNDKYIYQLQQTTDSVYDDISLFEQDLNQCFKYYKYYFPKKNIPAIYTFVSGFNCAIAPTDSILGIGLDYFLGNARNYYSLLDFPEYQKKKLKPAFLTTIALQQWIRTEFATDSLDNTLLAAIVNEGKTLYATKQCMPNVNDTILFGFTQKQLNWCKTSEFAIWSFLVDKKLLFNTNQTEYNRYIADGPFTPGMPRESPARATCWLGYKIIDAYMNNNSNINLEKLMLLKNAQTILTKSKYKPHK